MAKLISCIPANILNLLQAEPTKPEYRASVRAQCGFKIPDDAVTYDSITTWLANTDAPETSPRPTGTTSTRWVTLPISGSQVIYGSAAFRETERFGRYDMSENTLLEIISEATDIDDAIEQIESEIRDNPPDMEPDGDVEYTDHDRTDRDSIEFDYRLDRIRDVLRDVATRNNIDIHHLT